jgi:hypothetical protein
MGLKISESTSISFDLKSLGVMAVGLSLIIGMWFTLQNDIAEAKELPKPLDPVITRMEFDMKDQLIRQTIMSTQEDVQEIKDDIKLIKEKLYE